MSAPFHYNHNGSTTNQLFLLCLNSTKQLGLRWQTEGFQRPWLCFSTAYGPRRVRDALSQCSVTQKAPMSTAKETPLAPADALSRPGSGAHACLTVRRTCRGFIVWKRDEEDTRSKVSPHRKWTSSWGLRSGAGNTMNPRVRWNPNPNALGVCVAWMVEILGSWTTSKML